MIIGLVGLIGGGKDTAADYLVSKHGFQRDSFAAPLKDAVASIFNWDRELLEGRTDASRVWREQTDAWWSQRLNMDITPRWVLQQWGTEVARTAFHNDVWVASMDNRLRGKSNIVITDCRFRNEIATIHNSGGKIFRISRGKDPSWVKEAIDWQNAGADIRTIPASLPHASEWSWLTCDIDGVIDNNGTVNELHERLNQAIDSVRGSAL